MAARHELELAAKAMAILGNPQRVFASSEFIKLEVLPKAVYHKNEAEVKFYKIAPRKLIDLRVNGMNGRVNLVFQ